MTTHETNERRSQILEAAAQLLQHYGATKTTVADIARQADIGVGSVYLEFNSKNAIIGELAHQRHNQVLDAMRTAINDQGDRKDLALRAAIDARFVAQTQARNNGPHSKDLIHCAKCKTIKEAWCAFKESERDLIAQVIQDGNNSGLFHSPDPTRDARAFLLAYAYFEPPRIFDECTIKLRQHLDDLHDLVLRGLLSK